MTRQEVLADIEEFALGETMIGDEKAVGRRFDHHAIAVRAIEELADKDDEPAIERFARLLETVNALLPGS